MPPEVRARRQRGIALFFVIWVSLLITLIATGFTRDARVTLDIAATETAAARAGLAARAGVDWMALVLAAQSRGLTIRKTGAQEGARPIDPARRIAMDGRSYAWRFDGHEVAIGVLSERGKVDLNRTDPAILRRLLTGLRLTDAPLVAGDILRARKTARRLVEVGEGGGDSASEGLGFLTIHDLPRLTRIAPQDLPRLTPLITVHGQTRPDPLTAPSPVLDALALTPEERARVMTARQTPVAPVYTHVFTITATARSDAANGAVTALVQITPQNDDPIQLLSLRPVPVETVARE